MTNKKTLTGVGPAGVDGGRSAAAVGAADALGVALSEGDDVVGAEVAVGQV